MTNKENKKALHTPGPWTFVEEQDAISNTGLMRFRIKDTVKDPLNRVGTIASVNRKRALQDLIPIEETRANARLIAAAPDMLMALHEVLEMVEGYEDVVNGYRGQSMPNRAMVVSQTVRAAIAKAEGGA